MSETICTYSMTNILGGSETILRIERLQMKKYDEEASTNEASNQKIQITELQNMMF